MRTPEPNWDLNRIPVTFPYILLLFHGAPAFSRPRMAPERRAKLFAPFDALDGFSDTIRDRNDKLVDALERQDLSG